MPVRIGDHIIPAQTLETLVAIGSLDSPLEILSGRKGEKRDPPIPIPISEGPANTK